jgi:predicted DNA binding CopG/RHH family protein
MKKKTIKYTDESINARVIKDFLPKPEDLVFKEDNVKVTLSLSKKSIDFFKQQSEKFHTHYQTMIRLLLDQYAENFK